MSLRIVVIVHIARVDVVVPDCTRKEVNTEMVPDLMHSQPRLSDCSGICLVTEVAWTNKDVGLQSLLVKQRKQGP
ncbi:MAG: hypothetical protein DWQ37_19855 [Planctomycetota bacterium]|nr:MAG: hypothetical protein DWQ37_19855 [Planctomycetota bacterium]